jgi:hypothetical protein
MKKFEELLSFSITEALANDKKPKSTENSESKAAEKLEMEQKQSEQSTKSTAEGAAAAIPLSWTSDTNMYDNHNNNTKTTSPSPSTTNEDKNNEGDGVRAPKRGRPSSKNKSAPLDEEMLVSPPQKKPANEINKGMEVCKLI